MILTMSFVVDANLIVIDLHLRLAVNKNWRGTPPRRL